MLDRREMTPVEEEIVKTACPDQIVLEGLGEFLEAYDRDESQRRFETDDFMDEPN